MLIQIIRFLLIISVVAGSAFGVAQGLGKEYFEQLGAFWFIPQTAALALVLWILLRGLSKSAEAASEKKYIDRLEKERSKIIADSMAKARAAVGPANTQPSAVSTGAFKIEGPDANSNLVFNKDSSNEVNEQLSHMLYFMNYNFKAYTAAAFIYDANSRTLVLNCYQSKSAHIIEKARIALGSGVVGQVANENRLFISGDLSLYNSNSSAQSYYNPQESVSSVLAVPVTVGNNELIGVLLIDSKDKNFFREQDKELMKRFSVIAAALIVNIRMNTNLELAAKMSRLLYKASHDFSVALKIDEIFKALFAVVHHITPSCVRLVYTALDTNKKCFIIQRIAGQRAELNEGMEFPINSGHPGLYALALTKNEPIHIPDLVAAGNKYYRFSPGEPANPAVKSIIVLPVLGGDGGKCIGLFSAESSEAGVFGGLIKIVLTTILENTSVALNRSHLYHKMEKLATTDGLTGLNNHRTFQECMDNEIERARRYNRPLSLLLTDIDHFKSFNDTYGHPVGDLVLREVAACIRNAVRAHDIPARYGGEEFAVIIPESDEKNAAIIAERIRVSVENRVIVNEGKELRVTISIGCATLSKKCETKQDIIDCSDKALYAAKGSGRNKVCIYSPEMAKMS